MRLFATILICWTVLILAGCKSRSQTGIDPAQELAAANVVEIPLPAPTPFDSFPSERAAYINAYRDGYRSGLVSVNVLIGWPAVGDRFYSVRTNGWRASVSAGFSAHLAEVMQEKDRQ